MSFLSEVQELRIVETEAPLNFELTSGEEKLGMARFQVAPASWRSLLRWLERDGRPAYHFLLEDTAKNTPYRVEANPGTARSFSFKVLTTEGKLFGRGRFRGDFALKPKGRLWDSQDFLVGRTIADPWLIFKDVEDQKFAKVVFEHPHSFGRRERALVFEAPTTEAQRILSIAATICWLVNAE